MSDEQREILQMVSDGKISADDGAKLLEALDKGNQKRREMESPATRAREKKRIIRERIREGHVTGIDGLRDISRMVRGIISESVSGIEDDESVDIDEDIFEDAELIENSVDLEKGTELILKRNIHRKSKGDLTLNGVKGSTLIVTGEDAPEVYMYRDNRTVFLKWDKGDLVLEVPETVENVNTSLMGGDITLNSIDAATDIKTKGGDIKLNEVSRGFRVKTMGGDILITLNDSWHEDSKVTTMGGDIELNISENTNAFISAKTFGGEISVQDEIPAVSESVHPGASRVNIDLSEGEESPELRVKTMGGDISIRKSGEESVDKKQEKKKDSRKKKKRDQDE